MRLENKVILVTASTNGIGKAIVEYCAREGALVYIAARNMDKASGLIEGYKKEAGEKVVLIRNEEEREELESLPGIIRTANTAELFTDITLLDNWLQEWVEAKQ